MARNKQRKPLYGKKHRYDGADIFAAVFVGIIMVPLGVLLIIRQHDNEFGWIFGITMILSPLIVLWDSKRSPEQKARDKEEAQMVKTAAMIDYLAFGKKKSRKRGSDSWLEQTGGYHARHDAFQEMEDDIYDDMVDEDDNELY